ncbi:MAG: ClpXP protease specificity-enhancing factor SspB [Gemmobacter sp.]
MTMAAGATAGATLRDLTRVFLRIGCLSFGGPAAQIALMHRELVDDRKWLSEPEYLRALSFCMLLPGPEAMQLATYAGWRLAGVPGGLIAGLLFVLPGALVVLALSMVYAAFGQVPLIAALFFGVQGAVLAIVLHALQRVAKKALKARWHWGLAVAAFVALYALNVPFPLVVIGAGLFGLAVAWNTPAVPAPPAPAGAVSTAMTQVAVWGALWLVPLAALGVLEGGLLFDLGVFFSKLAVVTFGGAYAVLAWMTQEVVQVKGWLTTPEMIAGLGLAETTPGPLILVNQFVGYLAAFKAGGVAFGVAGAVVALWMTFVPCFLWIFAGAPFIERLAGQPRLSQALAGITAAVVGVIASLSLWFALHVLFGRVEVWQAWPFRMTVPDLATVNGQAMGLAALSAWLILWRHWGLVTVLGIAAGLALILHLLCPPPFQAGQNPYAGRIRGKASMARSIDYGNLMHRAMRGLIQTVLTDVAHHGLPGAHHFFITFDTKHAGVAMADWLRSRYPGEMTVVIQHWFENLEVTDEGFSVTLNFGNQPEPLVIPFDAVRTFVDPSVEFGLRFETHDDEDDDDEDEVEEARPPGEVVSLDKFRK